MTDTLKSILYWSLDRLSEQSTWKGIIGLLTAAGVFIDPDQATKIIALGVGVIALINTFRNEKKQIAAGVQKVIDANALAPKSCQE